MGFAKGLHQQVRSIAGVQIASMLDILSMSVDEIYNDMLEDVSGIPGMTSCADVPCTNILGRCDEKVADAFIEINPQVADYHIDEHLSEVPVLGVVHRLPETLPAKNKSPFSDRHAGKVPPGLFGAALRDFGRLRALCAATGMDDTNFVEWFCAEWGVNDPDILNEFVPILRGSQQTVWSSMYSASNPALFLAPNLQRCVRVQWLGKTRASFPAGSMVNWSKVESILRYIGVSLMVNDAKWTSQSLRIYYRLDRKAFPVRPVTLALPHLEIPHLQPGIPLFQAALKCVMPGGSWLRSAAARGDKAYVKGPLSCLPTLSYDRIISDSRFTEHYVGAFDITESDEAFMQFVEAPPKPKIPGPPTELRQHESQMLDYLMAVRMRRNLLHGEGKAGSAFKEVRHELRGFFEKPEDEQEVVMKSRRMVLESLGADFLVFARRFLRLIYRDQGDEHLFALCRIIMHDARKLWSKADDLPKLWSRILADKRSLKRVLDRIPSANVLLLTMQTRSETLSARLLKALSRGATYEEAIEGMCRMLFQFWHRYYRAKAKALPKSRDRVISQAVGALYRNARVILEPDGDIHLDTHGVSLLRALHNMAGHYREHRRKFNAPVLPCGWLPLGAYDLMGSAAELDRRLAPPVPFVDCVRKFQEVFAHTCCDIRAAFRWVFAGYSMLAPEQYHTLEYQYDAKEWAEMEAESKERPYVPEETSDEDPQSDYDGAGDPSGSDYESDDEPVKILVTDEEKRARLVKPSSSSAEPEREEELSDDECDDVGDKQQDLVSLSMELAEDFPRFPKKEVVKLVGKYGDKVSVEAYKRIVAVDVTPFAGGRVAATAFLDQLEEEKGEKEERGFGVL